MRGLTGSATRPRIHNVACALRVGNRSGGRTGRGNGCVCRPVLTAEGGARERMRGRNRHECVEKQRELVKQLWAADGYSAF